MTRPKTVPLGVERSESELFRKNSSSVKLPPVDLKRHGTFLLKTVFPLLEVADQ
jgi:hypothetical protein